MEGGNRGEQSTADARCDPVPNLTGRSPTKGQHQDFLCGLPSGQAPHNRFDDRGGLARARTSEHQERPVAVIHHGLLASVQLGRLRPR